MYVPAEAGIATFDMRLGFTIALTAPVESSTTARPACMLTVKPPCWLTYQSVLHTFGDTRFITSP